VRWRVRRLRFNAENVQCPLDVLAVERAHDRRECGSRLCRRLGADVARGSVGGFDEPICEGRRVLFAD
jgi:hypothetical protein